MCPSVFFPPMHAYFGCFEIIGNKSSVMQITLVTQHLPVSPPLQNYVENIPRMLSFLPRWADWGSRFIHSLSPTAQCTQTCWGLVAESLTCIVINPDSQMSGEQMTAGQSTVWTTWALFKLKHQINAVAQVGLCSTFQMHKPTFIDWQAPPPKCSWHQNDQVWKAQLNPVSGFTLAWARI